MKNLRSVLIALGAIVAVVVGCMFGVAIIVKKTVPSGEDVVASAAVHRDFEQIAKATLFTNREVEIMYSAKPRTTTIFIQNRGLTEEDKQTLRTLAERIGLRANRPITIVFR